MAFLLHLQSEAVLIEFRKKGLLYTYYCLLSGLFVKWEIKWITILASLVDPIGFGAQGLRTNVWCESWMDYFGSMFCSLYIYLHARITRITFIHQ